MKRLVSMQDDLFLFGLFESLLFSSAEPVSIDSIKNSLKDQLPDDFEDQFYRVIQELNSRKGGIQVMHAAGGYFLVTRPQFAPYIRRFNLIQRKTHLSRAACETLAIIAYQQPVTAPEVENIRGVDSTGVLRNLLEKDLITILGKKKAPGNPMIYGTTSKFLMDFGLSSLAALPDLKEFEKLFQHENVQPELNFNPPSPENEVKTMEDIDESDK